MNPAEVSHVVSGQLSLESFEVEFEDPVTGTQRGPLGLLWNARFERMSPVRSFPRFKGQTNMPGERFSASAGRLVGHESQLEKAHAMLLDFDPLVSTYSSQPFRLHWVALEARPRKHTPDFFARLVDDTAVVVDVRPDDRIPQRDAEAFAATARACSLAGWEYRRVGNPDPVFCANVRWLAGYRRRFNCNQEYVERAAEVFVEARPLFEGACEIADKVRVLPTLYHLMWRHVLTADLHSSPLGPSSMVALCRRAAA